MRFLIKKFIIIIILIFSYSNLNAVESVKIILKINDEIITNIDIQNEYNYLAILNSDFKKIERSNLPISRLKFLCSCRKRNL